jgi:hypothetical protein
MIWYLEDLTRFRQERGALEALALRVDWLTPIAWRSDNVMRLIVDLDISVGGRNYPVSLQYSNHFPHAPPLVLPRGDSTLWSSHQYGPGGELCLEYGPDNWLPSITGAEMVESAHRLLRAEQATPNEQARVASRHAVTVGQELRGSFGRLLVTRALAHALDQIPPGVVLQGRVSALFHDECAVYILREVTQQDGTAWKDESVPPNLRSESFDREASVSRFPGPGLPSTKSLTEFRASLAAVGLELPDTKYAVIVHPSGVHAYFLWSEDDTATKLAVVPAQASAQRSDAAHSVLAARKVAVVGCGSIGSKLAIMLARGGVGEFLLVDDDVVFPDNFVRHDLDWRDAGTHKADSVARRIQLVNSLARCTVRRHRLAGQEASGSLESLLTSLASCDLIVDATAEANVFNLLSAAVASGSKPFLWAQVFAGGFGGLVARHRPGLEPDPQYMRLAIEDFFADRGQPLVGQAVDYGLQTEGAPMIADDADVTVIAAHAARLAVDTLIARAPSAFPHAIYLVGLGEGSIFTQAFEAYPVDVSPAPPAPVRDSLSPDESAAEMMTILRLFRNKYDGNSSPSATGEAPAS